MNDATFTKARRSVEALLTVEARCTGASEIAALVLLSAYNSFDFSVPVADLGSLDGDNYKHALNVITVRYMGFEPHTLVENGSARFEAMRRRWEHLSTNKEAAA